mgnify:CR=1 FL=1
MNRYIRKFEVKEAEISPRPSKNEMDLMSIIFDVVKFYPKTVMTAYSLYERISKICGKNPIPLYRFQGDVDSNSALKIEDFE